MAKVSPDKSGAAIQVVELMHEQAAESEQGSPATIKKSHNLIVRCASGNEQ